MTSPTLQLADSSLHTLPGSVETCYIGKLYYVGFRRTNLYGPTALYSSGKISALHTTFESAERYIQPLRARGTRWEIIDVPAVIVGSEEQTKLLLVGDGWGRDTLKEFKPTLPPKTQFGHLARALMAQLPKEAWALRYDGDIPVAKYPFGSHNSIAGKHLSWTHERWIVHPESAIRLVSDISVWLSENSEWSGNNHTTRLSSTFRGNGKIDPPPRGCDC